MIRNKIVSGLILLFLGCTVIGFGSCTHDEQSKSASQEKFTCPMHPQIMNDGPGTCPICKMDLVPVNASGGKNELTLSESQIQLANVRTMKINSSGFKTSKILNGRLLANENRSEVISARYAGRVDRLFVKETGRQVSKGQALYQIYSEQLQTLQQDYLLQLKQVAAFPTEKIYQSMRDAAKNKLRLFGYTDAQIQALNHGAALKPLLTVYSKSSGIVKELNITEGQYLSEGSPVMKLESFDQLWLEMDIYPSEMQEIKTGTKVNFTVNGIQDKEQLATIDFISPEMDPSTQILKARAVVSNSGLMQPGMQVSVFLPKAEVASALSLPLEAVVRDEKGAHVWIKTRTNTFSPKMVRTGEEDQDRILIVSGLENSSEVVISGAYLLSSEFILKKGVNTMSAHDPAKM